MYRRNNSEARVRGKMTLRVAATANRMRMSERPKFLKRRQGRLKGRKHNHKKTGQEKIKQAKPAAAGER